MVTHYYHTPCKQCGETTTQEIECINLTLHGVDENIICEKCKKDPTRVAVSKRSADLRPRNRANYESDGILTICRGCGTFFNQIPTDNYLCPSCEPNPRNLKDVDRDDTQP